MTAFEASKWIAWDHSGESPKAMLPREAPAEAREMIRGNRDECLELARHRFMEAPPDGFPNRQWAAREDQSPWVMDYAMRQAGSNPLIAGWLSKKATEPANNRVGERIAFAAEQLVLWQLARHKDPFQFVVDMNRELAVQTK